MLSCPPAALADLLARQRQLLDERLACAVWGSSEQGVSNGSAAQHPVEPIRAKQDDVTAAELDRREVQAYILTRPKRIQDDVLVLEGFDLVCRELARLEQLVDERMIARDLYELSTPENVGSGVADMRHEQRSSHDRRDGRGRAAAALASVVPVVTIEVAPCFL